MGEVRRRLLVNSFDIEEQRIAILRDGELEQLFVERMWDRQRAGDIYKARVDSVLPGMGAAFVNLGDGRNAFLYLGDARGPLRRGMEVMVQVVRVARRKKGARVTTRLSIPGRFLVLAPRSDVVGVSRRIEDEEERRRLKELALSLRPEGHGLIVRTAAMGVDAELLREDLGELLSLWGRIERESQYLKAPCLVYRDSGLLGQVIRDELDPSFEEVVVDSEEDFELARELVSRYARAFSRAPEVKLYRGATPLFEHFGVEAQIERALQRRVPLPSGGYLVFDQTEALTVIDVNSGSFVSGLDVRDTIVRINREAALEIARQLKLRAIGGIVVVDFIDMDREEDKRELISYLEELLREDRAKPRVFGVTGLGLVEITRKRSRSDLRSVLGRSCPCCGGEGWTWREEVVSMRLKRFLRKVLRSSPSEALVVEMHPEVASFVLDVFLESWEEEMGVRLFLVCPSGASWGRFRLVFQGGVEEALARVRALEGEGLRVLSKAR